MQAWRAANALTREQVAVHLGCSWATIRGYELGKREPLISIVLLLEKWHPGLIKAIGKEKR